MNESLPQPESGRPVASQLFRAAHSCADEPRRAAQEFYTGIAQPQMAIVLFFCSSDYDLDALGAEMARLFSGVPVVGCTTAGEIGPAGCREHSLSGVSFPGGVCAAVSARLDSLQEFSLSRGQTFAKGLLEELAATAPAATADNTFAFMLIDGLSMREEAVASVLQHALGKIPLFGGSAGDGLNFAHTFVYHDGRFHSDSAVLILTATSLPFKVFKTEHFVSSDERLVVTDARAAHRIVREINGLPAAKEYARLIGVDASELSSAQFAASPVVVRIDGVDYVRSIQKANPDGSLTFYSAMENGLVLRLARGVNLAENLNQTFDGIREVIGAPQLILGCDCILRRLEIAQSGSHEVEETLRRNNTVGFCSYGEQFRGVHVNQTFTGVAIGSPSEPSNV